MTSIYIYKKTFEEKVKLKYSHHLHLDRCWSLKCHLKQRFRVKVTTKQSQKVNPYTYVTYDFSSENSKSVTLTHKEKKTQHSNYFFFFLSLLVAFISLIRHWMALPVVVVVGIKYFLLTDVVWEEVFK